MSHAFITVVAPFEAARAGEVEALLDTFGNPAAPDLRRRLDEAGVVHFASAHVVRLQRGQAALVFELSADGGEDAAFAAFVAALAPELAATLAAAGLARPGEAPAGVLAAFRRKVGIGWFDTPGLVFAGAPGMSARRIQQEAALAARLGAAIANRPGDAWAKLEAARDIVRADPELAWALQAEPAPILGGAPGSAFDAAPALIGGALASFLWPLAAAGAALVVLAILATGRSAGWLAAAGAGVAALFLSLLAALALLLAIYRAFRAAEASDAPDDSDPSAQTIEAIMQRENHGAQNHLAGVSLMKPGWVRLLSLRFAFFVIGVFAAKVYRPGQLGEIGSIHFARWILLPGTDTLLFLSNYDGSWEAYLEDFIEKAHEGLTAVWSNTRGYPRTRNLFQDGATDGDRFKRWARRQQQPTSFWYSAYPGISMARIRVNAAIRQGLAAISTRQEAADWLAGFGSAPAPADAVEIAEAQTLIFGGLPRLPHAAVLLAHFGEPQSARDWLAAVAPAITFGPAARGEDVAVVAFSSQGLTTLGLKARSRDSFPAAFLHGMAAPWRARLLGDVGASDPWAWNWGQPDRPVELALLLYAPSDERLNLRIEAERLRLEAHGHKLATLIRMAELPPPEEDSPEPFGFEDGLSQPIIRGLREAPAGWEDQVVAPGEFILGYPDNRGHVPPTIRVDALDDLGRRLPALSTDAGRQRPNYADRQPNAERDFGRNGAYLVIRQLEQNVGAFRKAVEDAAAAAALGPSPVPPERLADWIAAKVVGRWPNGDSLVNHPWEPGETSDGQDNAFRFGEQDPDGRRCPFGAHIRRANPRDSFSPGNPEQIAVSNRHRILRVGRPYAPERGRDPGLLFMCLNADIQRQFEFLQQSWILGSSFQGLQDEVDPLLGGGDGPGRFTIPTDAGPLRLQGFKDFVKVLGGGYFFMPSRSAVDYLLGDPANPPASARPSTSVA